MARTTVVLVIIGIVGGLVFGDVVDWSGVVGYPLEFGLVMVFIP
jgi:hypothetical protein